MQRRHDPEVKAPRVFHLVAHERKLRFLCQMARDHDAPCRQLENLLHHGDVQAVELRAPLLRIRELAFEDEDFQRADYQPVRLAIAKAIGVAAQRPSSASYSAPPEPGEETPLMKTLKAYLVVNRQSHTFGGSAQ